MWQYEYSGRDAYLAHHGIKGQRWGIRRYQNEDGSLTIAGEKRYAKVASNARLQKRDTKIAKQVYGHSARTAYTLAESDQNASSRQLKRANELMSKSASAEKSGRLDKAEKYKEKATKNYTKSIENAQRAKTWLETGKILTQKVKDINDGTLKAGEDFIAYKQTTAFAVPTPAGVFVSVSTKKDVIERKK